jgi:hypothetical protein
MVVNDLDLIRCAILPAETDAPLVIDPNAMLAHAVADELLESVARRDAQILERLGGIHSDELAEHGAPELRGVAAHRFTGKEPLRGSVAEALDHWGNLTRRVSNVKRYYRR